MSWSFSKKDVALILDENSLDRNQLVYAYGVRSSFIKLVPDQFFIAFDGEVFTFFQLSLFHKVRNTEQVRLDEMADIKVSTGLSGGCLIFKLNGKKRTYEIQKNLLGLKETQKEFLEKIKTLA